MGDMYDAHAELADMYEAGLIMADGAPVDQVDCGNAPDQRCDWPRLDGMSATYDQCATHTTDLADETLAASHPVEDDPFDMPTEFDSPYVKPADPARPEAKRGRYTLPNPDNGKARSWQRVTNFVKLTDDTYHLELWKQRNVAKGLALLVTQGRISLAELVTLDVKADRARLNDIVEAAQTAAEAYKMSDEGTALHTSTELADYADGDLNRVPDVHRVKVQMYRDALAVHGLTVAPGMIERVTASLRYECAGKFDRIYRLANGDHVIGDLKTGDSLDLSMPAIAAQLNSYEEGINEHGVFDGQRYDDGLQVRRDFGIVVHLPSTRDEVTVYKVYLDQGRIINAANLTVRAARKIKAKHVSEVFQAGEYGLTADAVEAHWLERMNAAHTVAELVSVAEAARSFGQWTERLADQARMLAEGLRQAESVMGS